MDGRYLTERPARTVLAEEDNHPEIPVWVHEGVAKLVRKGDRSIWEPDPTKDEITRKQRREAWRNRKAGEPVTQVDHSLQIHFTPEARADITDIVGRLHNDEAYDPRGDESDFEDFDEVIHFTLTRTGDNVHPIHPEAWRVNRFKPSTLFDQLESVDHNQYRVVTLIEPLQ